jgi:acyl carrier protein
MNKAEFMNGLKEAMELESEINENTLIKDLEVWDSINAMILKAFISSNFSVNLSKEDIESFTSVGSIIEKIGNDKF